MVPEFDARVDAPGPVVLGLYSAFGCMYIAAGIRGAWSVGTGINRLCGDSGPDRLSRKSRLPSNARCVIPALGEHEPHDMQLADWVDDLQ